MGVWLGLFITAVVALLLASGVGIWQLSPAPEPDPPIEWPPTWAEILAARGESPITEATPGTYVALEAKSHRHNLHCSKCGRFAAKTGMLGVGNCKYHGMTTRLTFVPDLEVGFAYSSTVSQT